MTKKIAPTEIPETTTNLKSGIVSIIGRSNAGKSTLINTLVGTKISAVTDKPQTTRNNIHGVLNGAEGQIVWLNPVNMQQEATLISDAFIAADPDNADAYSSNAAALTKKLKDLDAAYISGLKNCTVHAAVVSHNAFRYMAKQYGFETLAIAGLSPDEEPSSKRIAELADFAKKNDVRVIFFESLVSPKLSETVANEIGAQSLVLNPIEGLTSDEAVKNEDYIRIMKLNLQNLRTALQCQEFLRTMLR
jgi:ABC-type Zn uptake system ZnuABC Zn-binding protein ZnuA